MQMCGSLFNARTLRILPMLDPVCAARPSSVPCRAIILNESHVVEVRAFILSCFVLCGQYNAQIGDVIVQPVAIDMIDLSGIAKESVLVIGAIFVHLIVFDHVRMERRKDKALTLDILGDLVVVHIQA